MTRETLPARRLGDTFSVRWRTFTATVTVGRYEDGRVGEIFIRAGKAGEDLESASRDAAIVASLALQAGVQLSTIRHALTREESGAPSSLFAAVIDAVAKIAPAQGG